MAFIPFLNGIKGTSTLWSVKKLLEVPLLADSVASCPHRAHEGLKQCLAARGYIL